MTFFQKIFFYTFAALKYIIVIGRYNNIGVIILQILAKLKKSQKNAKMVLTIKQKCGKNKEFYRRGKFMKTVFKPVSCEELYFARWKFRGNEELLCAFVATDDKKHVHTAAGHFSGSKETWAITQNKEGEEFIAGRKAVCFATLVDQNGLKPALEYFSKELGNEQDFQLLFNNILSPSLGKGVEAHELARTNRKLLIAQREHLKDNAPTK